MKKIPGYRYVTNLIWTDYFGQLGVGFRWIGIKDKGIHFERDTLRPGSTTDIFAVELARNAITKL